MIRVMVRSLLSLLLMGLFSSSVAASEWTHGMNTGTPEFKSMGPLAFGPEGILFAADSKAAALFAIDTGDTTAASDAGELKVEAINEKIAALLGTGPEEVLINDMVVNPISRNVYLAVSRGRGPDAIAVLVRVGSDGTPHVVSFDGIRFSRCEIPNAPADVETGEMRPVYP